jgi:alpha-L-rhamnosidase
LGGINVDLSREGAQRLVLHPVLAVNIQWARVHYRSALGEIESEWHRGATETVYNFTVPANATATIEIDSMGAGMATVNGVPSAHAPGVLETRIEGAGMKMTVGSGKYEVRVANLAR